MAILIIGEKEKDRILALRQKAYAEPVSMERINAIIAGKESPIGDHRGYAITVGDYRVAFSIEEQPPGNYKHLSISNMKPKTTTLPSPYIALRLMKEFGFKTKVPQTQNAPHYFVWKEEVGEEVETLNLLEKDDFEGPDVVDLDLERVINSDIFVCN